ncbi:MAG: SGNH/GDSL hydrolase family protein, partial [Candidatus Omnitrophica bacterium]|nr:SGNH/GDSL hydrolase family protein [Candidatus Omnitrophota bacterium]
DPPLFEASDLYGYRLIPNQDIRRFGNRIFYNTQGLRSEPIAPQPSAESMRILCIGDSITYGGSILDQSETYPYQLESILNSGSKERFEVLNASAPGWSIPDEESYISAHGIYNSHLVILQISKDDLFQIRCSKDVVGNSPNYPSRKPVLALQEIFVKYLPRVLHTVRSKISAAETTVKAGVAPPEDQLRLNLISLQKIQYQVNSLDGELIVVFIGSRTDDVYKTSLIEAGKKQFFDAINALDIDFVDLDDRFSSSEGDRLLRDKIHPNVEGNRVIVEALAEHILRK